MQENNPQNASIPEDGWDWISVLHSEFRMPLSTIRGCTTLLLMENEKLGFLTEDQRKFVSIIAKNNKRMSLVLQSIFDLARIPRQVQIFKYEKADVRICIEEALKSINPLIEAKSQSLTIHVTDLSPLPADKYLLITVIERIVENASQYTPENGKITISTEQENNFVKVTIIDTGFGVDIEDQKLIFENFYRSANPNIRKEDGIGMSLYFCKKCIEYFGGQIGLESEPGKGSTFWFTLPIATDENNPVQPSSHPQD